MLLGFFSFIRRLEFVWRPSHYDIFLRLLYDVLVRNDCLRVRVLDETHWAKRTSTMHSLSLDQYESQEDVSFGVLSAKYRDQDSF